jgi:hypothetical protein
VNIIGNFAVNQSWITNIETKARELAVNLAEKLWEQEEHLRSKSAATISQIRKQTSVALDIESKLLDVLWQDEKSDLAGSSATAFNDRLNELDSNSEAQFISFWSSRVVDRVRLYAIGLAALEEGTLKTQLADVLQSHISQELIPSSITRAKAKKLVRISRRKIPFRLEKLVGSITAEGRDLPGTIDDLEKFNAKMEIPIYDDSEMVRRKQTHLEDMLQSMQKEKDGPRLFLCLVIILFAEKMDGVVYATGKYAPRLLKLLKPTLDQELAHQLEQWKEAVKGGTVTHEMRADMRRRATKSLLTED